MRRWWQAAGTAIGSVSGQPELWVPGALVWVVSVGWIPFLVAVARPPTAAELTFLGARLVTSGAWPWNVALLAGAALLVAIAVAVLAALGDSALLAQLEHRRARASDVVHHLTAAGVTAMPVIALVGVLLVGVALAAPGEFNAPDRSGGPVLRTALRLAPIIVVLALAVAAGAAFVAISVRRGGVRRGWASVRRLGAGGWLQVGVGAGVSAAFAAFAIVLLRVLWEPIGIELDGGRIGLAGGVLLVGFVAIWLCLVLAGGAVHAWSAATWSQLLERPPAAEPGDQAPS